MDILYKVEVGSKLYNLNTASSDNDFLIVYANSPKRRATAAKQKITDESDAIYMDLSTFTLYANRSAHQVLEAMFADDKFVHIDKIKAFRQSYYINRASFNDLYCRTIRAFWNRPKDRAKGRRNAVRLSWSYYQGHEYGRFNPTCTNDQRQFLLSQDEDAFYEYVKDFL